MNTPVKGIILAAGRGSRMGSLTEEKPKCMVSFEGSPLIEKQIESLTKAGVTEIAIVCGYRAEILSRYSSYMFKNESWESTNMLFSLLQAEDWLLKFPCIVSYSDIFYEPAIVKELIENQDLAAIGYDPDWLDLWSARFENPLDDAESFKVDSGNFLTEIGNKVSDVSEIEGQYMGLLKFTPKFWNQMYRHARDLDAKISMTEFINYCIRRAIKIKAVPNNERWGEIDSPEDLEAYKIYYNK